MKYSVLMSVYYKEHAGNLRMSMESMFQQTVKPDEFILVCDGKLTPQLDCVIEQELELHRERLKVIRLPQNGGLGKALNHGMKFCRNELIARMDSDDISRPDRCERQLAVFTAKDDVGIVSGLVEEFSDDIGCVRAVRKVPETHNDIRCFSRRRNPFNHPCVMFKKQSVLDAGGYEEFYLLEDYYLWIRMLNNGVKAYNIQAPLLWMRAGAAMYKRRSGLEYVCAQFKLFNFMYRIKYITMWDYLVSVCARVASSMMPDGFREYLFFKVLRR